MYLRKELDMTIVREAYVEGIKFSLELAEINKKYNNDMDSLIVTLKAMIEKENGKE